MTKIGRSNPNCVKNLTTFGVLAVLLPCGLDNPHGNGTFEIAMNFPNAEPVPAQAADFTSLIVAANNAQADGRHQEAAELWRRTRDFEPNNVSLLIHETTAWLRARNFAAADAAASAAMADNPQDGRFAVTWLRLPEAICDWKQTLLRCKLVRQITTYDANTLIDTMIEEMAAHLELAQYDEARALLLRSAASIPLAADFAYHKLLDMCCSLGEHRIVRDICEQLGRRQNMLAHDRSFVDSVQSRSEIALAALGNRPVGVQIASLGQNCLPFLLPIRWGLADAPHNATISVFDLGSHIANTAAVNINDDFANYLDPDGLQVRRDGRGVPIAFQMKFNMGFFHERGPSWLEHGTDRLVAAYRARIAHFRSLKHTPRVTFVFCLCGAGDPHMIVEALREVLQGGEANLLIVDVLQNATEISTDCPGVIYRHLPYPRDYTWSARQDFNSPRGLAFERVVADEIRTAMQSLAA